MKLQVFNQEGKEIETIEAPKALFEVAMNKDLLHQVVTSLYANARVARAHTKDRAEVRGGGKKPWRQKGTGRARHGSIRSPIWRGGGITHGPTKERNFSKKINKKMAIRALAMALSAKARDTEIVLLDNLLIPSGKTKDASAVLKNLSRHKTLASLPKKTKMLLLPDGKIAETRAFRNIDRMTVYSPAKVTAREVLSHGMVIIPQIVVAALEKRVSAKS